MTGFILCARLGLPVRVLKESHSTASRYHALRPIPTHHKSNPNDLHPTRNRPVATWPNLEELDPTQQTPKQSQPNSHRPLPTQPNPHRLYANQCNPSQNNRPQPNAREPIPNPPQPSPISLRAMDQFLCKHWFVSRSVRLMGMIWQ